MLHLKIQFKLKTISYLLFVTVLFALCAPGDSRALLKHCVGWGGVTWSLWCTLSACTPAVPCLGPFNLECVHHLPCLGLSTDSALQHFSHEAILLRFERKAVLTELSGQVKQVQMRQRNDYYLKRISHQIKLTKSTACVRLNIKDTGCVVVQELGTSKQDHPAPRRSFCLCLCFCFCLLFVFVFGCVVTQEAARKQDRPAPGWSFSRVSRC